MPAKLDRTDAGATPVDWDRQLLLYKLQKLGLLEARADGEWQLTQSAANGLALVQRGEAHATAEPQPVRVRPWVPRRLGH
jgi:hypothetical protein